MSTTFSVRGLDYEPEDYELYLNCNARNARDLLSFLGLTVDVADEPYGEIRAGELRKLIDVARARPADRGRLGYVEQQEGRPLVIAGGRPPERMGQYLDRLEALCGLAGDLGIISWG